MLRVVDISRYWRNAVKESKEFKQIAAAENPEFYLVWQAFERVLDNQFLYTMDDYGLSKWEQFLKVSPFATDTIDDRRFRIKTLLMGDLPYTMRSLINKLNNICGQENVQVSYIKPEFLLDIRIAFEVKNQNAAVAELLRRILPANIIYHLIQYTAVSSNLKIKPNLGGSVFVKLPLGIAGIGGSNTVKITANTGSSRYTVIAQAENI